MKKILALCILLFIFLLTINALAQETQSSQDCPGCMDENGICYVPEEQHELQNKIAYCKSDHQWYEAKSLTQRCDKDYQCKSKYCTEGKCATRIEKEDSFLTRFLKWIWGVFFS